MMGLPKFHTWKLPSRNWCIFWSVLGSFAGAVAYDRYEKRQIIARYKSRVAHLSTEVLQPLQMPRRVNVYMGAPPGDTIHVSRDHFNEYVKPILNSAAVDFECVEGKMQGDIRHRVAQTIRNQKQGIDGLTDLQRASKQNLQVDEEAGDIVIGRHTYKEYIRGLHEGYLGPLEEPAEVTAIMNPRMPGDPITEAPEQEQEQDLMGTLQPLETSDDTATTTPETPKTDEEIKAEIDAIKAKIPSSPPSYITPASYSAAASPHITEPTYYIYVPINHLLGFLNTPWRIYRFLNRRQLAEQMCSATAAAVLASSSRDFSTDEDVHHGEAEEMDWPKKNRTKPDGVWVEQIVLDKRITEHLKVYQYQEPPALATAPSQETPQ